MTALLSIFLACLLLYTLLLLWMAAGFLRTGFFNSHSPTNERAITLIVCARNEEKNIARCLGSLMAQDYPAHLLNVIVVNDGSTDNTGSIAQSLLNKTKFKWQLITNPAPVGKKQSIIAAIQHTQSELIITRDADTYTLSDKWLLNMVGFYNRHLPDMIVGPIALGDNQGLLWALQAVENNILAVLSCGSAFFKKPFLASGANLLFTKKIFFQTGAYQSHLSVASGDDVLFLEEVKKAKGKIMYLKNKHAIVNTYPCYSLPQLIQQKVRWASKFKVNSNPLNLFLALISFATNLGWLFCLAYGFLKPNNNSLTLLFVVSKLMVDFLLLLLASSFIKNRHLVWLSLPVGFIYPLYATAVALASLFMKPKWK